MAQPERWALGYFSLNGDPFTGLVRGSRVRDLRQDADLLGVGSLADPVGTRRLLERWDRSFGILDDLARSGSGAWHPQDHLAVYAPVEPKQVLQAGANYRTHVIDLVVAHHDETDGPSLAQVRADAAAMLDARVAEGTPYIFTGLPSAMTGPHDDVALPTGSDEHDWELELAAVIGAPGYRIPADRALDHVAAYVIVNDLTTRDAVFRRDMPEIGTDWFRAKNSPGFLPVGPWLVPAAFVGNPQDLQIRLALNGAVMQDASTSDMMFSVAQLVAAASETVKLSPGDLILTGSPAGNGAHWGRLLRDGDVMEGTITGLGVQRTSVFTENCP